MTTDIVLAIVAALGTGGAAVVGLLQTRIKADHDAALVRFEERLSAAQQDIAELKAERDEARELARRERDERHALKAMLEKQGDALAEQSGRLTETINALTRMTLERDWYKQQNTALAEQVKTLTAERDTLSGVAADLRARVAQLEVADQRERGGGDPPHA